MFHPLRLHTTQYNTIATSYGLDGPGIESRWGRYFPHLSRPALRPTQPPVQWVPGLSEGKAAGAWRWPPTPPKAEVKERAELCYYFDMYMSYGWGSTGENVTSERHTRALHDVASESYTTWRQICRTKDKISLHGSFTRMRILPRAYRNTVTRIRFDASGYFSSSAIPLCVSGHVSFAIW